MSMPRALLVLTEFPPSFGGMQTHAVSLAKHLPTRGYEVEIATYRVTDPRLEADARHFDRVFPVKVHRCLSRLGFWRNVDVLERMARQMRADLIYSSTVFYGALGERTGLPVVCRSVGNDVLRPWQGYPYHWCASLVGARFTQRLIRQWLERGWYPEWAELLFHNARLALMRDSARAHRCVLANSVFTRDLLLELGVAAERIVLVTGGVDVARFRRPAVAARTLRAELGLPEDAFVLMTACRLVAKKGLDLLLHAVRELRRDLPVHLVVAGEGRERGRQEALAGALGLGEHVSFRGRVDHGRIERFYWASDAFVLASREAVNPYTGTRDVETMGRVLCEANAAGLPVVASASGGIPSVVTDGDNGLLFPEGDVGALTSAVRRLADDPGLARRLARRGVERAQAVFDWTVVVGHHERVFAQVLARSSSVERDRSDERVDRGHAMRPLVATTVVDRHPR